MFLNHGGDFTNFRRNEAHCLEKNISRLLMVLLDFQVCNHVKINMFIKMTAQNQSYVPRHKISEN